eukprot:2536526-Prorocentrum_lima.AAC.1
MDSIRASLGNSLASHVFQEGHRHGLAMSQTGRGHRHLLRAPEGCRSIAADLPMSCSRWED